MSNRPVQFEVCIGDSEKETILTVSYDVYKAIAGGRDSGRGLKLEPDEPACIEINYILDVDGLFVRLSKKDEERLKELINEYEWDKLQDSRKP